MKVRIRKFFSLLILVLGLFFTASIDFTNETAVRRMEYGNSTLSITSVTNFTPTNKMEHYYSKLVNIILNSDTLRCCTLTTLGMIFSYYDSFCYDGIVTEYDTEDETHVDFMVTGNLVRSPGVDNAYHYINYFNNVTYTNICSYSDHYCNLSLFAELVMLALREGIYVQDEDIYYDLNGFGMSAEEKERLLIRYLTFHGFFKNVDYEESLFPVNTGVHSEQFIRTTITNELANQRPVMASIPGHSLVIFGYDASTNEFICHNGYVVGGQAQIVRISYSELTYINPIRLYDSNKEHSKNYYCTVNGILGDYCGCEILY